MIETQGSTAAVDSVVALLSKQGWKPHTEFDPDKLPGPMLANGTLRAIVGPLWTTVYRKGTSPTIEWMDSAKTAKQDDVAELLRNQTS